MRPRAILVTALALGLLAPPAHAWPAGLMERLARDARRLLPAALNRLLAEREDKIFEAGKHFPVELQRALAADLERGGLRPETLLELQAHLERVPELMREKRVSEAIIQLGASYRIPADLADPVLSVGPVCFAPGVVREYYAFVEANLSKIPVVLEDRAALQLAPAALPEYWKGVLQRSRQQSHVIGEELFQRGRVVDHRTLDYRNPAFAVGSLSYSRAVNAIAVTWLAQWRGMGGDTTRMPVPIQIRPRIPDEPRE
jgi:hypothetical protein